VKTSIHPLHRPLHHSGAGQVTDHQLDGRRNICSQAARQVIDDPDFLLKQLQTLAKMQSDLAAAAGNQVISHEASALRALRQGRGHQLQSNYEAR
jgi:hypothetical protein